MTNYRRELFRYLEAGIIGLFFVQGMRFLYGTLYAHLGSIDQLSKTASPISGTPGLISRADVQTELLITLVALLLPLLAVLLGRWQFGTLVAAVVAAGRVYMTFSGHSLLGVSGAAITVGGAALYMAIIARRRPHTLPILFILGFAADQLIRLYGFSADLTWDGSFLPIQAVISLALFVIAVINVLFDQAEARQPDYQAPPRTGISSWGALAMGGLLYLEFALLGLPNTVARRAGLDPLLVAPWLIAATLLPIIPGVRDLARRFLGMFDGQWRGWVWFLLTGLLIVIGFRFSGPISAFVLIAAQVLVGLSWWWIIQPTETRGNFSGPGVAIGLALFLAITGADYFTYDYAFVRGLQEPFGSALRALRGLGLAVALISVLLVNLPPILARKRLPWRGGRFIESVMGLLVVVLAGVLAYTFARPTILIPPTNTDRLRIATLNLHGGYSLYFNYDLISIANEIKKSGADVILLQEVEAGRLVSYGVDQAQWLGRVLDMQIEYFPTNEALQGLAILTRVSIEQRQGVLLTSLGKQTGVQYVRLRAPDQAVLDVYNTQLGLLLKDSSRAPDQQEQDQIQQMNEIFGLINQNDPTLTTRTLIGGTFNNVPTSDLYQRMAQYFSDPFAGFAAEKAITWRLINNVNSRVDYLWLRRINSLQAGVVEMGASTHNMAVLEIGLLSTGG